MDPRYWNLIERSRRGIANSKAMLEACENSIAEMRRMLAQFDRLLRRSRVERTSRKAPPPRPGQ
jgi:hypothetical protein